MQVSSAEGRCFTEEEEDVCVSVPLRVPRPGPDVGKVAQCLSHDPRGSMIETEHHRKSSEGKMDVPAEATGCSVFHRPSAAGWICLSVTCV